GALDLRQHRARIRAAIQDGQAVGDQVPRLDHGREYLPGRAGRHAAQGLGGRIPARSAGQGAGARLQADTPAPEADPIRIGPEMGPARPRQPGERTDRVLSRPGAHPAGWDRAGFVMPNRAGRPGTWRHDVRWSRGRPIEDEEGRPGGRGYGGRWWP